MSTGANTGVRRHIDPKLRNADRKGGNQTDKIESMTEAEPVTPSNPPKISHFPDDFFNNIDPLRSFVDGSFAVVH